jgi:hypothetical protein
VILADIVCLRFLGRSTLRLLSPDIPLGWWTVAPAGIDPTLLIIFRMVHHAQNEKFAMTIVDSGNHTKPVITHVENKAVSDLISRSEDLLYLCEVRPFGVLCKFVPSG